MAAVVGKRDDELLPKSEAETIVKLNREVLLCGAMRQDMLYLHDRTGRITTTCAATPIATQQGSLLDPYSRA
jgi:hypothetical protein